VRRAHDRSAGVAGEYRRGHDLCHDHIPPEDRAQAVIP
jgi:hypothetical protein